MMSLLSSSVKCRSAARIFAARCPTIIANSSSFCHHQLHRSYYNSEQHHHHRHGQSSLRCFGSKSSGDESYDDEWIPPDDSPLNRRGKLYDTADATTCSKPSAAVEDEEVVEVIDLEATLNSKSNQQQLQQDDAVVTDTSEFEVHASNVEWDDILSELKESGEDEMLQRLVQEYGLEHRLEALNERKSKTNNLVQEKVLQDDDEEDWLYEEESFEGSSDEDIIDELIENSPSLSQLELEILSQELKRLEEDGGMDFDSLDDANLDENAQYQEFRAMVLEDYKQKKQKRLENKAAGTSGSKASQDDTGEKSDFSEYPQNWTDYDSKKAFQRDFLQDDGEDAWIPPSSSEFVPSHSYEKNVPDNSNFDDTIDWLEARRSRLKQSEGNESADTTSSKLMTPDEAEKHRNKKSQIDAIPYTLFTSAELSSSLSAQGGKDIHIIDVADYEDLYGVGIGCSYLMLVTGRNSSHIRVMADSIVRNLKARKLNERGIVGAMKGVEGGTNIFANKRSRARASKKGVLLSAKIDDDWMCVDCGNIHVHLLEEATRKCINIESLWNFSDPNSEGNKLRRVDFSNDDEVDTYVAENPVPEEYSARMRQEASPGGWMTGDNGRVILPGLYNRKSFSAKWSGSKKKSKGRRQR